mgnify:FL=1|tara:strand:+ start:618 stop:824 length:207 start_codon:yes stop_codon:yes gene_type:complete
MTIQEIMEKIKAIKGDYQNNMVTADEMCEHLEDLIHDVQGNDEYSGWGTAMEDDGFYDTPDFTQLVVD